MSEKSRNSFGIEITDEHLALFGRIRDLRAEIQNIQRIAVEVKAKSEQAEPSNRDQAVKAAIQRNEKIFRDNRGQIESRLREVRSMLDKYVKIYDLYGDPVANIENAWQRATLSWPTSGDDTEQALQNFTAITQELKSVVLWCGMLTIPNRVRQHLSQLRIGGALDFHASFADELPEIEDRLFILRYIHSHPAVVKGVVSLSDGLIFKAAETSLRRTLSLWLILSAALFGFVAVWASCWFGMIICTSEKSLSSLMQGYALVLVGAVAHVLVDFLKMDRASKANTSGLQDWVLQIHVQEISFLKVAISLWIGFLLLAYSTDKPIDWKTAFLLGYGIDSFLDLFLQRFASKVASGTTTLQRDLGGAAASPHPIGGGG
ncbi:MAG: hypothetical protein ABJC13_05925 [Acidobacteriota bacterium]